MTDLKQSKSQLSLIKEVTTPSQFMCMLLTLTLLIYFPAVIKSSTTYEKYRMLERPDYEHESLYDFWMVIPISFILRALRILIRKTCDNFFRSRYKHKYSDHDLDQKVEKCCKGVFKIIYFSFTSYVGMSQVLNKTSFSPKMMLGNGDIMNTFGNYPYTPMPSLMKFYYMLSLSYYVEDGITHLVQTPKFDYWEMVLHHVITGMLIFSSFMNGFWVTGIFVLFQMDF